MTSRMSVLAVVSGIVLALGVVAFAGLALNPLTGPAAGGATANVKSGGGGTSESTATTTAGEGNEPGTVTNGTSRTAQSSSQPPSDVQRIAGEPTRVTGFVVLPVVLALALGVVLYRVSRRRTEAES